MSNVSHKRVLGIVGSPRRGGNTEVLVDEILRGAQEAGAHVEKVVLVERSIAPCRGCDSCAETHVCAQEDDMPALMDQMRQSDVWVLGTPVYWWGPSAQFKAFLDRWYSASESLFKGRRVVLVVPMGDTDSATGRHVVGMMEDALGYVEAELFATVLATGVNKKGEVRGNPELMSTANATGRNAAGN